MAGGGMGDGRVALRQILWVWLGLGAQSWGGGAATLMLIRQAVVDRYGWVDAAEFSRLWAVCQIAPGINLLGLTAMIGWRLARWPGVALALIGLLLPSVAITVLLTAGYAAVRAQPAVADALRGVVPATVGLGLLLTWQLAAPLLRRAAALGRPDLIVSALIFALAVAAMALLRPPVIAILLAGGALGALWGLARGRLPG